MRDILKKIGFGNDEAELFMNMNSRYYDRILPLINEYKAGFKKDFPVFYKENEYELSHQRTVKYIEDVKNIIPEITEYESRLLAWINLIPYLYQSYKENGIDENIFFESMKDFSYKLRECRDVHGEFGLFVDWFFIFFDLKLFALGRLQYEMANYKYSDYSFGEYRVKKGDKVYSCHIPSSGKLSVELCMDSLKKAYEFFLPQLKDDILPVICCSWLLYKPYVENVFSKDSNIYKFSRLFDINESIPTGDTFGDSWRVFGKMYNKNAKELPEDTTLRRNFKKYINDGGDFGAGVGIILYNGKTGEIINEKIV